jgi:hypothetical protein
MSKFRWRGDRAGLARTVNSSATALLQSVIVICLMLVLWLLWWGRNRGFDITDEGMYLLVSLHPQQVSAAATLFYVYLASLYDLVGGNIGAFRVIGYVLVAGSALTLWFGLRRCLATEARGGSAIGGAAITVSGALLIYVWFLPTPSYNLLNTVAVYLFAGALLTGLAALNVDAWRTARIAWFSAGLVIGLDLFVKFPTAILLLLLAALAAALWPQQKLRVRLTQFGLFIAGMLVWLGFHFLVLQSPAQVYGVFSRGLEYAARLDTRYTAGSAITRILADSWNLLIDSLSRYKWIYLLLGVAMTVLTMLPGRGARRAARTDWLLALAGVLLIYSAWHTHWYIGGVGYIGKITPLVGGVLLLAMTWRAWRNWMVHKEQPLDTPPRHRQWLLVMLFLVGLPFVAAAGTNNPLGSNMALCMAPWFAAIWVLFTELPGTGERSWLHWVVPVFLVGLATAQVVTGCLKDPYRLRKGLAAQTVPTLIGAPGSTLYLDPATSDFIVHLRRAAAGCGIGPGTPVLAFYNMPGLVYALGGTSPGVPWYVARSSAGRAATLQVLKTLPPASLQGAAVMTLVSMGLDLPDLTTLGVAFPAGYRKCAVFQMPPFPSTVKDELTLWAPVGNGN